jgi:dihydroneopterin aldolase
LTADRLTVFVRQLRLEAEIGVWAHERGRKQPVVIDIAMEVDPDRPLPHKLAEIVRYDEAAELAARAVAAGHIDTVETLAAAIADGCLKDPRVQRVTVTVEKPHGVAAAQGVGVVLQRTRPQ